MEATWISIDRGMDKKDMIYMCVYIIEYYSAIKQWSKVICSNMDGLSDYHTEWSRSGREKPSIIWYCLYVESKKMWQMNLFTKQNRVIDVGNKFMVANGKMQQGGKVGQMEGKEGKCKSP